MQIGYREAVKECYHHLQEKELGWGRGCSPYRKVLHTRQVLKNLLELFAGDVGASSAYIWGIGLFPDVQGGCS